MSNTNDAPPPEDIAGLFRRFDGDAHAYKEFAPPEPVNAPPPKAWALLSGARIERAPVPAPAPLMAPAQPAAAPAPLQVAIAPVTPVAPVAPAAAFAPAAAPEPAAAPAPAAVASAVPAATAPPVFAPVEAPAPAVRAAPPVTELQALFARLLVEPQARTSAATSPMSRWRRPT